MLSPSYMTLTHYSYVAEIGANKTLSSITISGASSVTSGESSTYTCTAHYSDGTAPSVSPTWSIDSGTSYASVSSSGRLTASTVTSAKTVTLKAAYGGKSATKNITINPKSTPVTTYTITYKPGTYGIGSQETATKTQGVSIELEGSGLFERTGYSQDGWSKNSNGSTLDYRLSATYSTDASITLYPHWKPQLTSISIQGASSVDSGETETYTCIATYYDGTTKTVTPEWSINSGSTYASIDSSGKLVAKSVSTTCSVTIAAEYDEYYDDGAEWKDATKSLTINPPPIETYTIIYKPGTYGTGSQQSAQKTKGVALTLRGATFTRTGYTQTGWSKNASGSTKDYNLNASYTVDAAVTLYPYWTANLKTFTISYQPGTYGSGSAITATKTEGQPLTLFNATFTRKGYTQTGWALEEDRDKAYELNGVYSADSDITLYPYWTANTYTIAYSLGGGNFDSLKIPPASVSFDERFSVFSPVRAGYSFVGWTVTSGLDTSTAYWVTEYSFDPEKAGSQGHETRIPITSSLMVCGENSDGCAMFKNLTPVANGSVTLTANWAIDQEGPNCEFALSQGWTWVSVNVEPDDASFASIFRGVSFADNDVVKSSDGSATYYGGAWYPSPATFKIVPGRAYAVKKSMPGDATVTVSGTSATSSLAVTAGWNWIGPMTGNPVSRDALKHSGGFTDNDVISSSSSSATYYGGTWYGSLLSLEPGVGYKAKFGKAGTLSEN